jgi:hypothetical protein
LEHVLEVAKQDVAAAQACVNCVSFDHSNKLVIGPFRFSQTGIKAKSPLLDCCSVPRSILGVGHAQNLLRNQPANDKVLRAQLPCCVIAKGKILHSAKGV